MSGRGLAVVAVLLGVQGFVGLAMAAALIVSRRRASRRAFTQIAVIIGVVESFLLAAVGAAVNSALGGSAALTSGLLWYVAGGWILVQILICVWWYVGWRQSKR